jgi:hypothetical protein
MRRSIALSFLVAGFVAATHAQTVDGIVVDGQTATAARAEAAVQLAGTPAVLKGLNRVAIGSFQVEFVHKGAASASSHRIGSSGTANTNVVVSLTGLSAADFQAVADAAYARTVADLKAAGLEVLPLDQVKASAAYRKLTEGATATAETRTKDTWSVVHAPAGMLVYGEGSASTGGFGALAAIGATMSAAFGQPELSRELDAAVLAVRLVVNFVDMKSSDRSWFNRSSGQSTVSWQYGPAVAPERTSFTVVRQQDGSAGQVRLALQAPLLIDGAAFSGVKDTSSVAGNIGLALLNMAIGKGGSSSAVEKEVVADPERYRALVGQGLEAASGLFAQRLKAAL